MLKIREKLAWGLVAAFGLFVAASITGVVSGGPLDPPGPPGSTDGVRIAGTPISDTPLTITQPGRYYLTRDITGGAGEFGIRIEASDVTIDLGGFTLRGGANPGSGIAITSPRLNIVIRDGAVRGWFHGVDLGGASYSRIENVTAIQNSGVGISIGAHSDVVDCQSSGNVGQGVLLTYSVVRNCTVTDNTLQGIWALGNSLVQNNKVRNNASGGGYGIDTNAQSRTTIVGNDITGNSGGRGVSTVASDILYNNYICDDANSIAAESNQGNIAPATC